MTLFHFFYILIHTIQSYFGSDDVGARVRLGNNRLYRHVYHRRTLCPECISLLADSRL